MDLDILNQQHSSTFLWLATIWGTWSLLLLSFEGCQALPGGSSGERVHIRLHMPEVVRQHTHFHNVYKLPRKIHPIPALPPTPIATMHPQFPGKAHVQLLGYTTSVGNSGPMAPNLMQLMGTAATPTLMPTPTNIAPNYGPALFDNYNQESALSATTTTTTMRPQIFKASKQQQLLQQIFTPHKAEDEDTSAEDNQLESNSLLNNNFLEALQREYLSKFGGRRKRKKSRNPNKEYSNYYRSKPNYYQDEDLSETFEDYQDEQPHGEDYDEVMEMSTPNRYSGYHPSGSEEVDQDHAGGYDSAVAFSGQDNSISSSLPTMEDFLEDTYNSASSYGSGGNYEPYGNSNEVFSQPWQPSSTRPTMTNSWSRPTTSSFTSSSKGPKARPVRSKGRSKVRYVKLITRKKRKNHVRTKRYRT
ncbi:uncharacterized protein LOC108099275 [Drosophila ficusphila]|uniref:uncharacterized protein LOC108099275 n=1 Tax=Drosophila ficusphila TaxID=30025 RepID=UPI0007E5FB07|nr:uncharacterized protein LOC108099275 [Drosophila ficusphila]